MSITQAIIKIKKKLYNNATAIQKQPNTLTKLELPNYH